MIINQEIEKSWNGGYKLVINTKENDLFFNLPEAYKIRDNYDCSLEKMGDGAYHADEIVNSNIILIIDKNDANMPDVYIDKIDNKKSENYELRLDFANHQKGTPYGRKAQKVDNVAVNFSSGGMDKYTAIDVQGGQKCLKVIYPAKPENNWDWHRQFAALLDPRDEYYFSYLVKFSNNFVFEGNDNKKTGGKLPGLAQVGNYPKGKKLCSGGQVCKGDNGFTSRYMWRKSKKRNGNDDARMVLYLYHMDKPVDGNNKSFGENIDLDFEIDRGVWIELKQRVKLNTGNNKNGEVEVWINGNQKLRRKDLRFITNGKGIDTCYFSTFHGGAGHDWRPKHNCRAWFKDLKVWND